MLRFLPLRGCVDATFWTCLGQRKLNEWRTSEERIPVRGFLEASNYESVSNDLLLDDASFFDRGDDNGRASISGTVTVFNSMRGFMESNKNEILYEASSEIWDAIRCHTGDRDAAKVTTTTRPPARLCSFVLLVYADLKHFVFHYMFAFPALLPERPFRALPPPNEGNCGRCWTTCLQRLGVEESRRVMNACDAFDGRATSPFWAVSLPGSETCPASCTVLSLEVKPDLLPPGFALAFLDPCNIPEATSSLVRNVLLCAAHIWGDAVSRLDVLCARKRGGRFCPERSLLLSVDITQAVPSNSPKAVGWESQPRKIDLSFMTDPRVLAEQAVDLNLGLMRWRAAPDTPLNNIAVAKCLIFGAGTLGCTVARSLVAWGVRRVTLVDHGKVSYSNPVRQSLYEFADCHESRFKAVAAADALRRVFPGVDARGVVSSLPMPGHSVDVSSDIREIARVEELVRDHDAVFLLTDSREARWFPTVLAELFGKVAITSAVGFDSYLVMHHGGRVFADRNNVGKEHALTARSLPSSSFRRSETLAQRGCYFCNDIVAPVDSTTDRELHEQCTVSKPGASTVAGALCAELFAELFERDRGVHGPRQTVEDGALPLLPPHMIRGNLGAFNMTRMEATRSSMCTACSSGIVSSYIEDREGFVARTLRDPRVLEDVAGITAMKERTTRCLEEADCFEDADRSEDADRFEDADCSENNRSLRSPL